ncbi:hypothetical protein NL676_012254 [Syzygium grande]|nr:hypothetical protein NL676_012254 [Syzygium grande]
MPSPALGKRPLASPRRRAKDPCPTRRALAGSSEGGPLASWALTGEGDFIGPGRGATLAGAERRVAPPDPGEGRLKMGGAREALARRRAGPAARPAKAFAFTWAG